MTMRKLFPTTLFLCYLSICCFAQKQPTPAVEPSADFTVQKQGNKYTYTPQTPPQNQIAGAPTAYYDYYWEFGDGTYSFDPKPTHQYNRPGAYEAQLWATGKYDKGKSPKSRPKRNDVDQGSALMADNVPGLKAGPKEKTLSIRAIRNPRAEEELVLILTYTNTGTEVENGALHLFFNQKAYPKPHFNYLESRKHFGETEAGEGNISYYPSQAGGLLASVEDLAFSYAPLMPHQLEQKNLALYDNQKSWSFTNLKPGEKRNLFVSLMATPDILADTSAVINMGALYINQDDSKTAQATLEIEVLASHDPNYIGVSDRRMHFRGLKNKNITYNVHFQNNGEGPASRIAVTVDIPPGTDASQLKILETYPPVPICPDGVNSSSCLDTTIGKNQLVFTFKDIYLPGTKQRNVDDRDSTKGWVKYQINLTKKMKKYPFGTRASIVFDKNPPIVTNKAKTGFRPGLSVGFMAGRSFDVRNDQAIPANFIGLSVSPYKPYRAYWQMEFFPSIATEKNFDDNGTVLFQSSRQTTVAVGGRRIEVIVDSIETARGSGKQQQVAFNFVPLHMRKNLNDYIGVGLGVQVTATWEFLEAGFFQTNRNVYACIRDNQGNCSKGELIRNLSTSEGQEVFKRNTGPDFDFAPFADLQIGMARRGPALGARLSLPLNAPKPSLLATAYAVFRL
jgi:hypothetical protein